MTGRIHGAAGVVAGLGLAGPVLHLDLRPVAVVGLALLGALLPDIDRASSMLGRLVPEALWPTVVLSREPYRSGRGWGGFVIEHRGPTHSLLLGGCLALGLGLSLGWMWGLAFWLGWLSHLLLDGRQRLFWPLDVPLRRLRWVRLRP